MPEKILHLVIPGRASATVYEGSAIHRFNVVKTFRREGAKRFSNRDCGFEDRERAIDHAHKYMLERCEALGVTGAAVEEVH